MKIHFLLGTPGMPLRDPWRSLLPILRSLLDQSPKLVFQYKIPPLCFPVELPWSDSHKKVGHFTEMIVTVEDICERSKLHISLNWNTFLLRSRTKLFFRGIIQSTVVSIILLWCPPPAHSTPVPGGLLSCLKQKPSCPGVALCCYILSN